MEANHQLNYCGAMPRMPWRTGNRTTPDPQQRLPLTDDESSTESTLEGAQSTRKRLLGQIRSLGRVNYRQLATSTGLPIDVTDIMSDAVKRIGLASRHPWRLGTTPKVMAEAVGHTLDLFAGRCLRDMSTTDLKVLETKAERWQVGVSGTLDTMQKVVLTAGALGALPTEGSSMIAAAGMDLLLGEIESLLMGLGVWYLVGTYAAYLAGQSHVELSPHDLRRIVNGALLSRNGHPTKSENLAAKAEARLILRWFGRGIAEAVPFLPGIGSRQVKSAGRSLEATDLNALVDEMGRTD
jgi:hypothetical protein